MGRKIWDGGLVARDERNIVDASSIFSLIGKEFPDIDIKTAWELWLIYCRDLRLGFRVAVERALDNILSFFLVYHGDIFSEFKPDWKLFVNYTRLEKILDKFVDSYSKGFVKIQD